MRIVYLHGFASGAASGKAQWFRRSFAERGVNLEIPELVEGDFENITISGQLAVVGRTAKGEPVSLIGSSMGGYLAALYASRRPEVEKLVLLAPAFHFPQRWPQELGAEKAAEWRRTGSLEVFHYGEGRARNVSWNLIEDGLKYDAEPSFHQPALIFHGVNDTVVPPAYSEAFAERHPNVRLRMMASDHQLTDVTELMWNEIAPFLLGIKAADER
ncbi:MAG TPA: YqiA/YcfP family alpha/beta fold hydrolase [Bryobacteraceae bacterium]|nr:YqiA/YcfP family alpha/beta fold hydrolase [Bryobacteraceae bacterium]